MICTIIVFSVFSVVNAQTVICPTGYTCAPIAAQPIGCPVGYVCTPTNPITPVPTPVPPSIPVPIDPPCYQFSVDFNANNLNVDVIALQTQLIFDGFDIPAISLGRASKGYFGSQTVEALKKYQQSKGLFASGILDSLTRQKINSLSGCVQPPSTGVVLSVRTDKSQYVSGEEIVVYFKAYNNGKQPMTLKFNSGCQTAYSIARYDSTNNQACAASLTEVTILPQSPYYWEMKHAPAQYKIPVGQYKLEGRVLASNYSLLGALPYVITITDSTQQSATEQVKCVFSGSTSQQTCYTATNSAPLSYRCSGIEACTISVSGTIGTQLSWKSNCENNMILPITTIDGNNEYANFNCAVTNGNLPPVINGLDAPTTLSIGQTGTWTIKAYDPENGPLSYSVTWGDEYKNAAGQNTLTTPLVQQFTQSATFTHSYSDVGVYSVNVRVKDNAGLTSQTSASVNVINVGSNNPVNNPPKIIGFPAISENIQPGQMVNFSWTATDPDNDYLAWSIDWGDNIGQEGTCPVYSDQASSGGIKSSSSPTLTTSHSWSSSGIYMIKVTVSDCRGGTDSNSFRIEVGNSTNSYHSADINHDMKIDGSELTAFQELFDYRSGTVRTGEYNVNLIATRDIPSSGSAYIYRPGTGSHTGPTHSADTNKDWQISLTELLRVIELKNASGYKVQAGTEDGFAPVMSTATVGASPYSAAILDALKVWYSRKTQ